MFARMLPSSMNRAAWIVSPDVIPQLYTMSLSVGTGGAPMLVVNASGAGPMTLFGRYLGRISLKLLGNELDYTLLNINHQSASFLQIGL